MGQQIKVIWKIQLSYSETVFYAEGGKVISEQRRDRGL